MCLVLVGMLKVWVQWRFVTRFVFDALDDVAELQLPSFLLEPCCY